MKKICFVTATRSEYGLLKWLMKEVDDSSEFTLQLVVTGAHLLPEQGHTIDIIRQDGFSINEIVDCDLDTSSKESIAASMGRMGEGMAQVFEKLSPDYVAVLGDRYELLPIVNTAFVMRIPVIHISGGDITGGAIDDGIRNAVTMLSDYHFPGISESADNIIRMRGSDQHVWAVGEPGLDSFYREDLMSREELSEDLGISSDTDWVLFTFHAETKKDLEYNMNAVRSSISALKDLSGVTTVLTYSNADFGGREINDYLESVAGEMPAKFKAVPSLGNRRYLSFMRQVKFLIGNSSSGIVEAPALGVPVINIGDRQSGRHLCSNVLQTGSDESSIRHSIEKAMTSNTFEKDFYWGDGHTSEKILSILKKELSGDE